jgi:hypothetical protein
MSLQARVGKMEKAQAARDMAAWQLMLTRLTDAELIELEACYSKAVTAGEPVQKYITPEIEAALLRVKR